MGGGEPRSGDGAVLTRSFVAKDWAAAMRFFNEATFESAKLRAGRERRHEKTRRSFWPEERERRPLFLCGKKDLGKMVLKGLADFLSCLHRGKPEQVAACLALREFHPTVSLRTRDTFERASLVHVDKRNGTHAGVFQSGVSKDACMESILGSGTCNAFPHARYANM